MKKSSSRKERGLFFIKFAQKLWSYMEKISSHKKGGHFFYKIRLTILQNIESKLGKILLTYDIGDNLLTSIIWVINWTYLQILWVGGGNICKKRWGG